MNQKQFPIDEKDFQVALEAFFCKILQELYTYNVYFEYEKCSGKHLNDFHYYKILLKRSDIFYNYLLFFVFIKNGDIYSGQSNNKVGNILTANYGSFNKIKEFLDGIDSKNISNSGSASSSSRNSNCKAK